MALPTPVVTSPTNAPAFGLGATITWSGAPLNYVIQDYRIRDMHTRKDATAGGIYVASASVLPGRECDVDVLVFNKNADAAGSNTLAATLALMAFPPAKGIMTITGGPETLNLNTWNYEGAEEAGSSEEFTKVTIHLSQLGYDSSGNPSSMAIQA